MTNVAESPRTDLRFTQVPLDQKLYLCAGRDVKTVSGTFALRGYGKLPSWYWRYKGDDLT